MWLFIVEWLCIGAFTLSGVFAARDHKADLDMFGVVLVGVLTAVGGGTIRDILLSVPVTWMKQPDLLYCPVIVSVVGFFLTRGRSHQLDKAVLVLDAVGLAFFTVWGTHKALFMGYPWLICMVMGLITGVGGGMMRDAYTGQVPLVMRTSGGIYAIASLIGALVVVLVPYPQGLWAGGLVCFTVRLAALRKHWALPGARW